MNIFVTNPDPIISAQELCDQHVRSKMQIESAIMLQHCFTQETLEHAPKTQSGKVRKTGGGYYKHQCSVWVRESKANFEWLVEHTLEMFRERKYRWPDAKDHFTHTFIEWCKGNSHNTIITKTELTPFVVAIKEGSVCKSTEGFKSLPVTEKYKLYITHDKPFATWSKRTKPAWM